MMLVRLCCSSWACCCGGYYSSNWEKAMMPDNEDRFDRFYSNSRKKKFDEDFNHARCSGWRSVSASQL
jgi:hypothetical protein